ncbi:MAG: hypothetical protein WCG06_05225, partial [Candidatus Omnitrophota bacterium]
AMTLAGALLCSKSKGLEPCSSCDDCARFKKQAHPDLHRVEPDGAAGTIKIEAVRQILGEASLKPFSAPCKVFLVMAVETMNEIAQNAMLKTLEEPPANTFFLLISRAPERLLATVRSRCQVLAFSDEAGRQRRAAAAEDPLEAVTQTFVTHLLEKAEGSRSSWPGPDLARLERKELAYVFAGAIACLRSAILSPYGIKPLLEPDGSPERGQLHAKLAALSQTQSMEIIERLAEFRQLILESIQLRLALSAFWIQIESLNQKEANHER